MAQRNHRAGNVRRREESKPTLRTLVLRELSGCTEMSAKELEKKVGWDSERARKGSFITYLGKLKGDGVTVEQKGDDAVCRIIPRNEHLPSKKPNTSDERSKDAKPDLSLPKDAKSLKKILSLDQVSSIIIKKLRENGGSLDMETLAGNSRKGVNWPSLSARLAKSEISLREFLESKRTIFTLEASHDASGDHVMVLLSTKNRSRTSSSSGHMQSKAQGSKAPGSHQILVRQIPSNLLQDDLMSYFKQYGPVKDIKWNTRDGTSNEKRSCTVEFFDNAPVEKLRELHKLSHIIKNFEVEVKTLAFIEKASKALSDNLKQRTVENAIRTTGDKPGLILCARGISQRTSDEDLLKSFVPYGSYGISRVKGKGLAFIYFKDRAAGERAMKEVDSIKNMKIALALAARQDGSPSVLAQDPSKNDSLPNDSRQSELTHRESVENSNHLPKFDSVQSPRARIPAFDEEKFEGHDFMKSVDLNTPIFESSVASSAYASISAASATRNEIAELIRSVQLDRLVQPQQEIPHAPPRHGPITTQNQIPHTQTGGHVRTDFLGYRAFGHDLLSGARQASGSANSSPGISGFVAAPQQGLFVQLPESLHAQYPPPRQFFDELQHVTHQQGNFKSQQGSDITAAFALEGHHEAMRYNPVNLHQLVRDQDGAHPLTADDLEHGITSDLNDDVLLESQDLTMADKGKFEFRSEKGISAYLQNSPRQNGLRSLESSPPLSGESNSETLSGFDFDKKQPIAEGSAEAPSSAGTKESNTIEASSRKSSFAASPKQRSVIRDTTLDPFELQLPAAAVKVKTTVIKPNLETPEEVAQPQSAETGPRLVSISSARRSVTNEPAATKDGGSDEQNKSMQSSTILDLTKTGKKTTSWASKITKQIGVGPRLVSLKSTTVPKANVPSANPWGAPKTVEPQSLQELQEQESLQEEVQRQQRQSQIIKPKVKPVSSLARLAASQEIANSEFPSLKSAQLAGRVAPYLPPTRQAGSSFPSQRSGDSSLRSFQQY